MLPYIPPDQHVSSSLDSMVITEELILKKLIQLDVSKSPGPDNLHSVVLKTLASSLVKPLSIIYNTSIRTAILPLDWKKAHVSAVFKKGDRASPNNYRPISLTSILCKVLESLLRDVIINHLSNNKLFSTKQFKKFDVYFSLLLFLFIVLGLFVKKNVMSSLKQETGIIVK